MMWRTIAPVHLSHYGMPPPMCAGRYQWLMPVRAPGERSRAKFCYDDGIDTALTVPTQNFQDASPGDHVMTRLLELLISVVIVAVLFVGVGLLLPSSRTLTESVETNRRLGIVFDTLNGVKRFKDWNPVTMRDPAIQLDLTGPDAGVGAKISYRSAADGIGQGSWEIIESQDEARVVYQLENSQRGENKRMEFTLRGTGSNNRNVEITQKYTVDYGWNLFGRYAGMYVGRHVGDDVKLGLNRLVSMLAAVPNVEYRTEDGRMRNLAIVERPAENLLVVSAGAVERSNITIQDSMKANRRWIDLAMEANNLEPAGPLRIVTTELGTTTYTFDVALPVRRKRPASRSQTNADAAELADEGELGNLRLGEAIRDTDGVVRYLRTAPTRAVSANYTGYMAELEIVRNAMRAWLITTQAQDVTGRPYDVYTNGIEAAFTENGEFEVYWALNQQQAAHAQPQSAEPEAQLQEQPEQAQAQ